MFPEPAACTGHAAESSGSPPREVATSVFEPQIANGRHDFGELSSGEWRRLACVLCKLRPHRWPIFLPFWAATFPSSAAGLKPSLCHFIGILAAFGAARAAGCDRKYFAVSGGREFPHCGKGGKSTSKVHRTKTFNFSHIFKPLPRQVFPDRSGSCSGFGNLAPGSTFLGKIFSILSYFYFHIFKASSKNKCLMKKLISFILAISIFSSCETEKNADSQLAVTEPYIEHVYIPLTDAQISGLYDVLTHAQTRSVVFVSSLDEFRTYLNSSLVAVYFGASWCGPCRMYRPIFFKVSDRYTVSTCRFLEVDVDSSPDIVNIFGIMTIPTTIIIKDGKEVARAIGALQESTLVNLINNYI